MPSPSDSDSTDRPLGADTGEGPDSVADPVPDPAPSSPRESSLSERDERILEFERQWWRHAGAKEEAIRAEFSLSAARYYQLLNAVIDLPGAVRADPMLIKRLQRARDERSQMRAARAFRSPGPGADSAHPLPPESNN
jgi:hypothetical protein